MKGKVATVLLCLAFGAGFGVFGAWSAARLWSHFSAWAAARDWEPVPARILSAGLETRRESEGTTMQRVTAAYSYRFADRDYRGDRVGLTDGSDNLDDWQGRQFSRLDGARASGAPVTAWVDPSRPERAVLDRDIRWPFVAFMTPFAILFSLVAVGALAAIRPIMKAPVQKLDAAAPAAPGTGIRPGSLAEVRAAWLMAVCWNLIVIPGVFLYFTRVGLHNWFAVIPLLLAVVGASIVVRAIRLAMAYHRLGEAHSLRQ